MTENVPLFIRVRGCINCEVSKDMKRKTGREYGFDHEAVAACLVIGCFDMGHAIYNPFLDPKEGIKRAKETRKPIFIKNARRYRDSVKERFSNFYERIGISLDSPL